MLTDCVQLIRVGTALVPHLLYPCADTAACTGTPTLRPLQSSVRLAIALVANLIAHLEDPLGVAAAGGGEAGGGT